MSRFRWSNIPIPEGHVLMLAVGIALQVWKPFSITQTTWLIRLLGGSLLLSGIALASWATVVNIARRCADIYENILKNRSCPV